MKGIVSNKGKRLLFLAGVLMLWGAAVGTVEAQHYPAWWIERGVVNVNAPITNDYAAVNQGQIKWIVRRAVDEMNTYLPQGAGTALVNRVASFPGRNNYRAVNHGQLKTIASMIYDRLIAVGYTNAYPWTVATNDDRNYAAANQGMVKSLFAFDIQTWATNYFAVLYVDRACTNSLSPYISWETAATSIESAVSMAINGSVIWVADGTYAIPHAIQVLRGLTIKSTNGTDGVVVSPATGTGRCFEIYASGVELDGLVIQGGVANQGGGVYVASDCSVAFNNCSYWDNGAVEGGAVYAAEEGWCDGGTLIFNNCLFEDNRAIRGGAVYGAEGWWNGNSLFFNNCRFLNNQAVTRGGGMCLDDMTYVTLMNGTLIGNQAGLGDGGGIDQSQEVNAYLNIQNSILWSNSTPALITNRHTIVTFSTIQGGISGWGNTNNRTGDPGVIAYSGRLKWNSAAIDAGVSNALISDFEGEARWRDPNRTNHVSNWDMGADEFVDVDADHMADQWEKQYLSMTHSPTNDDDSDGLNNQEEYENDCNPLNADSDSDGLSDGEEAHVYRTNPLKADSDGDGLSDYAEIHQYGTNPLKSDSDGDGLSDADELRVYHTNPLKSDTDGDSLMDGEEIKTWHTDPLAPDSDGDGLYRCEVPDNGSAELGGTDTDGDGISDAQEEAMGLNPAKPHDGMALLGKARQRVVGHWAQVFSSPLVFHYAPGSTDDLAEMTNALGQLESSGKLYVPGR